MRKVDLRLVVQRISLALVGLLSIASFCQAEERIPAGKVNTDFSRVYIFVDKSGLVGHQHAVEGKLASGELFQAASREGTLVFDMQSFNADTPQAKKYLGLENVVDEATRKKVNENMLGAEILDVKKYSTAKLEHVAIRPKSTMSKRQLPEVLLIGDFTLHEKTRRIEIPCDLEVKDGWHHLRGSFKILQSNYGIKPFSKMLGAVGVADELVIYGDIWVVPE